MCWQERVPGDVVRYNEIIQHETLRVAVIGMLDNDFGVTMPQPLQETMEKNFLQCYEFYESTAERKAHLSGQLMQVRLHVDTDPLNIENNQTLNEPRIRFSLISS